MQFNLHPWRYRVRVCPGPLSRDGDPVGAVAHDTDILLSGTLKPRERLEVLLDLLRRLREQHHGRLPRAGLPGFIADVMRQLLSQGGEPALLRLQPDGMVDAGGMESLGAEPVGCECGTCGTRYGAHQITTAAPEFDDSTGRLIVRRAVDCDFCGHIMSWTEGATGAGAPNGRVMSGPVYTRGHVRTS